MALRRTGFSEESKRRTREKQIAKQRAQPRKGLKRSVPKQRARKKNGEPLTIIEQAKVDQKLHASREFRLTAAAQKVCARCGRSHDPETRMLLKWDAHHVVEKAWLKANGFDGADLYDPDNSLRLCDPCHQGHTNASARLHLRQLKTRNLQYAFRVMGAKAGPYLRRKYRGEDPRLDELEQAHDK